MRNNVALLKNTKPTQKTLASYGLVLMAIANFAMPTLAIATEIKSNPNKQEIMIDMSQVSTTKNEIAVLQVLSEICPPMLNKNQQQGFASAYNVELQRLMPTISNPKQAIQYLSTQADYKQILAETRQWTLQYPTAENKEICIDLATNQ